MAVELATILVADDSTFIRQRVSLLLMAHGHHPEEARNGEEACARYGRIRPALVLMNVVMPGMDGLTATRMIRTADPGARIVVMSALRGEHVLQDAVRAGALAFLTKPLEPSLLLSDPIVPSREWDVRRASVNAEQEGKS